MVAVIEKRSFRDFDWVLAFLAVAIVCFGVWQIYNAVPTETIWLKQIFGLVIALIALLTVSFIDYRRFIDAAPLIYGFGIFLLIIVLIPGIGTKINGQRCWIDLGFTRFQPSEFVKLPVVLMLAKYFGERRLGVLKVKEILTGGAILVAPIFLILLEPDAGQSLTYFPLLAVILFLSAVKIRWVLITMALGLIMVPAVYLVGLQAGFVKPYHVARIDAIIDPEKADPKGFGYHTVQSIITVGKGGLVGTRVDSDLSQSALKFLPEPQTDFIFAVTAENTGFVGCISLLLAYALLISRLVAGAKESPDRAGMLVIMAIAGGLGFQIFMNVGMTLGFLPVIGVPLPLMSAGLSSVLSTFIAIGFVISVKMRRFVN